MIFLMAMVPFFIIAPLIQALRRGVQGRYVITITALLLFYLFSRTISHTLAAHGWLIWVITFLIASLATPNPDAAKQNKRFIICLYLLAILADCILIPLMLVSYTH